jgi:hypothetical protein
MSNPNYPDGVNSLPYDKKETFERRLLTVEIDGIPGDALNGRETTLTRLDCSVLIDEQGNAEIESTTLVYFGDGGEVLRDEVYETDKNLDDEIIKRAWDQYYDEPKSYVKDILKDIFKK